jgi:hypothetical protein
MKGHSAVSQSEQRIIAAPPDISAGMYLRSALSYDYRSRFDGPAAKNFDA